MYSLNIILPQGCKMLQVCIQIRRTTLRDDYTCTGRTAVPSGFTAHSLESQDLHKDLLYIYQMYRGSLSNHCMFSEYV